MTSQPGLQTIPIHILPNTSQSKGSQTMKSGQLIEYNKINTFLQILCRRWGRQFLFFEKANKGWKQVGCSLVSVYLDSSQLATQLYIIVLYKLYKTLDYWSKDMLNFNFSEKGLGLVSPSHFVNDFSRKTFRILHSIKWANLIVWLLSLCEILGNMCITTVCYPCCEVTKFEINLIFLIKPFWYMTKKSRQKLKYLENKKCF